MDEHEESIKSVVILVYDECKDEDNSLVNIDQIIEFFISNFTLNSEEALKLKINNLFDLLKHEGKDHNNFISKNQFERVLHNWIPSVQHEDTFRNNGDDGDPSLSSANGIHKRLSRSLTNLKQQIEDQRIHKLRQRPHWMCHNFANDENECRTSMVKGALNEIKSRSGSPHEDPFTIPLNKAKSTIRRKSSRFPSFQPIQQIANLDQRTEQKSFSDSDTSHNYATPFMKDNSTTDKKFENNHLRKRRHRSDVEQTDLDEQNDLVSQLKQVKFKNTQLVEINDRLQVELDGVEENLWNFTQKCLDLEKKTKMYDILTEENKCYVGEIDDLRKTLEKEIKTKETLFSEKVMMESELVTSREHIQSLVEKLSLLNAELDGKDIIITNIKSIISQQQEFCDKLQELNLEKDDEIIKNGNIVVELSETLKIYEDKINTLFKEKSDFEKNYMLAIEKNHMDFIGDTPESCQHPYLHEYDHAAGFSNGPSNVFTTNSQFTSDKSTVPWSINVEMAEHLVDCQGDNPLCEKMIQSEEEWMRNDDLDDTSFQMLKELLTLLTSLRMTLTQYKDQLESASISLKDIGLFSDEVNLSYLSHLDNSIQLVTSSTEKAALCQDRFNETFQYLMKRISNLKKVKKSLTLKNEQLSTQINNSSNDVIVTEKIAFLQEELRKERLMCLKKQSEIQDLLNLKKYWKGSRCVNCGRFAVRFSVNSEMNNQRLASEALNLEKENWNIQQRRLDLHRSFSNIERDTVYDKDDCWLKSSPGILSRKSSLSLDQLLDHQNQEEENIEIIESNQQVKDDRNYYISIDDLSSTTPRYKLSRTQPTGLDIDKIIENSWLDPHSNIEERRASVFAQNTDQPVLPDTVASDLSLQIDSSIHSEHSPSKSQRRVRNHSSSCSSSNDTSDANSVDVTLERKKLAQELEIRLNRMQNKSPIPSTLTVTEDFKSITPTLNEEEQCRNSQINSDRSTEKETNKSDCCNVSSTFESNGSNPDNVNLDMKLYSQRTSLNRHSTNSNISDYAPTITLNDTIPMKPILPKISIVEVSSFDSSEPPKSDVPDVSSVEEMKPPVSRIMPLESEANSLQASMNRSSLSSRASSVVGDDSKYYKRSRSNIKRIRRPYTVTGIGLSSSKIIPDDSSSNLEDQSMTGEINDVQESIDLLQDIKNTLSTISAEDLENKFSEMSLIYKTDRPTVIERAKNANRKCNKALANVEQEFNILRHLIKSVAQVVDQPCELVPRIKASVSVLEKCVEYLSSKSETLGAIEQEVKMSSVIDVMDEYNSKLIKQREEHLRELEEVKLWRDSTADIGSNGSFDQTRSKRSLLAGKDPKTRFQMLAQNTVMKSSIIRQFTGRSGQLPSVSDSSDSLETTHSDHKLQFKRGTSTQSLEVSDCFKKSVDNETGKIKPYNSGKLFSTSDENGEMLFQKGLQQGLRLKTDQALMEMRAEQSRFSSTLDSLSDMIEECEPSPNRSNSGARQVERHCSLMKEKVYVFFVNLKMFFFKSIYIIVGFVVVVALLLPWLLSPTTPAESSSFSVPVSHHPVQSSGDSDDKSSPSSTSSSPFFANVNVLRYGPAPI